MYFDKVAKVQTNRLMFTFKENRSKVYIFQNVDKTRDAWHWKCYSTMLQEYKSVGNCNYQGQIYKTVKQPDAQILTTYTFIHSLV